MNVEALMELVRDEDAFKKAFRKTLPDSVRGRELDDEGNVISAGAQNEVYELLAGQFKPGRVAYVHQVTLPDGSQIRVKYTNTVKKLYNNKNVELTGKESFLSYIQVTVAPTGQKAYMWTMDLNQFPWKDSRSKALVKHEAALVEMIRDGEALGIDLTDTAAWSTTYSEIY